MTTSLRASLAVATLFVLAACGSETSSAGDPGEPSRPAAPSSRPAAIPAADGPVRTRTLVTVMDTGSPELCLGAVAESYPPQCGGPALKGWDWAEHRGTYQQSGGTRWGQYVVTGTFDGTTFTVLHAIPEAGWDPAAPPPPANTGDAGTPGWKLIKVQKRLATQPLPGTLSTYPTLSGVTVDVVYDDGSLQAWADHALGGLVTVRSALVPLDRQ